MALTSPDTSAQVIVNGQVFEGWKGFQVTQTFDQATGEATLRMSPQPGNPLPIMMGDEIQFICAGHPVMTGHVHRVWGDHDIQSHEIQAQCRDRTQDMIDSTIGPKHNIDPPCSLKDVCSKTLGLMGLGRIGVIDRVNAAPYELGEKVSGSIDERGHEHLERWAAKRHAVLTTDGKGNLVIDNNQGERLAGAYIHLGLPDDPLNNISKSSFGIDDFNRHNAHAVAGQKSPNDRGWEGRGKGDPNAQADKMSSRYGLAHDRSVRPERRKHSRGGKAQSGHSPRESAKWRANSMRAKSNEYVCTVPGFTTPAGVLWWPGKLVPVYDWSWMLNADLFLKEVSFTKDIKHGGSAQLKFALEDSYRPQAGRGGAAGRTGTKFIGDPGEKFDPASKTDMGLDGPDTEVEEDQ